MFTSMNKVIMKSASLVSELLTTIIAGEPDPSVERSGFVYKPSIKSMLTPQLQTNKHSPLQRTRSAETALNSDTLATTV